MPKRLHSSNGNKPAPTAGPSSSPATSQKKPQNKRRHVNASRRSTGSMHPSDSSQLRDFFGAGDESTVGLEITDDAALSFSAYYRAVQLIASSMAIMPIKIYRKIKEGSKVIGREETGDHPSNDITSWSPDGGSTTSYMWRETQTGHACMRGNGVSELVRNNRGQGIRAYNLDPRKVSFYRHTANGVDERQYKVMDENGEKILTASQVIHIPALSWDGWIGKSPLRCARDTIGLALATEKFGATYFRKGARPLGFLTKPNILNKTQRDNLRSEWAELHEGIRNALSVGVLSGGLDWKQIGVSPEEAQFLLTRKFQVEEIARWFGIPPHMLANMDNAKFNNVEQTLIEFMIFTMFPWIKRWEGELNLKLFTPKEAFTYYAEFNFDALLRVDTKTKIDAYERLVKMGARTLDEVRGLDNLNPYPDGIGALPLVQGNNMMTLQDVISGKSLLTGSSGSGNNTQDQNAANQSQQSIMCRLMGMLGGLNAESIEKLRDILDVMRGKTREQIEKERS